MSEPEVDHDDISDHILYHLRRMADDQHEGSELEVALRHAADRIERLLGHLNWLGWSDIDIEKHKAELEASRLGQKLLIAERDEAREAARMMVAIFSNPKPFGQKNLVFYTMVCAFSQPSKRLCGRFNTHLHF